MLKKSLFLMFILLLVGALTVSFIGCAPPEDADAVDEDTEDVDEDVDEPSAANPAKDRENTFTIASHEPDGLFIPGIYSTVYDGWVTRLMFDTLLSLEEDGSLTTNYRSLAEDWEFDEEENKVTFYLREGIKFHDGEEMTAEDVAFSWYIIAHPDYDGPRDYLRNVVGAAEYRDGEADEIEGINVIDDYTIEVYGIEPEATFERDLVAQEIMPMHHYDVIFEDYDDFIDLIEDPIGTGPFTFVEYPAQQYVELAAFDDYFLGRPEIDTLIYDVVSSEAEIPALEAGEADVIDFTENPENLEMVQDIDFARTIDFMNNGYAYIGFNFDHELIARHEIRQALAYGLNREGWVEAFFGEGLGEVAHTAMVPANWAFPDDLFVYEYDPDKANEILDDAGYEWDGDYRVDENGDTLEFTWTTYADVAWAEQITALARENWREIGVNLVVEFMEFNSVVERLNTGDFTIFNMAWGLAADPDITNVFHTDGAQNRGNYSNERADELMEQGLRTFDVEERKEIYNELANVIAEDLPYIFVYIRMNYWGINDRVSDNFTPSEFRHWHWNIHEISLDY